MILLNAILATLAFTGVLLFMAWVYCLFHNATFFQKTVIRDAPGADPLFIRYKLVSCRYFALYIHKLLRSDADRCLHDHPWDFFSFVLKGSYVEELEVASITQQTAQDYRLNPGPVNVDWLSHDVIFGLVMAERLNTWNVQPHSIARDRVPLFKRIPRKLFSVAYRAMHRFHRVTLTEPCWTLVLRLNRTRPWGFSTPYGWVGADELWKDPKRFGC